MGGREAFGPNLRRIRIQRGIGLDEIARRTKVGLDLWAGLERNDFSRWPTGIFARAYIREYAHAIGIDAEALVDEFCRSFPQGDRRAHRIVRGQAELVGHELHWRDDLTIPDRRAPVEAAPPAPDAPEPSRRTFQPRTRALIAAGDVVAIAAAAALVATMFPVNFWASVAVVGSAYHVCALAALGASPAVALVHWYVEARRPSAEHAAGVHGLRLLRGSARAKI